MSGFLDTSLVVRYMTRDVPQMAEKAAKVIDGQEDLWVDGVMLAEVDHVLRSVYRITRETVVDYLRELVGKQNINSYGLEKGTVQQALLMCRPLELGANGRAFLF